MAWFERSCPPAQTPLPTQPALGPRQRRKRQPPVPWAETVPWVETVPFRLSRPSNQILVCCVRGPRAEGRGRGQGRWSPTRCLKYSRSSRVSVSALAMTGTMLTTLLRRFMNSMSRGLRLEWNNVHEPVAGGGGQARGRATRPWPHGLPGAAQPARASALHTQRKGRVGHGVDSRVREVTGRPQPRPPRPAQDAARGARTSGRWPG